MGTTVSTHRRKILANNESLNKEYLPILGLEEFNFASTKLLLGRDSPAITTNRVFSVQTLSATGALRVGAEFLIRVMGKQIIYYSNPTWENHKLIFKNVGFLERREYRYWSHTNRGLDLDGLLEDLRDAPEGSVIVFHAVAHNPSGCDPTPKQWEQIAKVMKERKLFPFFDSVYQGFATGDMDKDAFAVRYFEKQGFEMLCAQAYSKNFGLYNERIGSLTVILNDPKLIKPIKSQLTLIIRGMYSNPPSHGARIISCIVNHPELYNEWLSNVRTMASRVIEMRKRLRDALEGLETPGDWSHFTEQYGMFSFTGLNDVQCQNMIKKYHIHMLLSGRISICGVSPSNIDYIAKAIYETVTDFP